MPLGVSHISEFCVWGGVYAHMHCAVLVEARGQLPGAVPSSHPVVLGTELRAAALAASILLTEPSLWHNNSPSKTNFCLSVGLCV